MKKLRCFKCKRNFKFYTKPIRFVLGVLTLTKLKVLLALMITKKNFDHETRNRMQRF